jgi:hypothetical protein
LQRARQTIEDIAQADRACMPIFDRRRVENAVRDPLLRMSCGFGRMRILIPELAAGVVERAAGRSQSAAQLL